MEWHHNVRLVLLLLGLSAATPVFAASGPLFNITVNHDVIVDTVTRAELGGNRAHLNFPFMKQHANGDLVVSYAVGQTQSPNATGRQAISTDGGLTWTQLGTDVRGDRAQAHLIRPSGQFSRGFGVSHTNAAGFTSWGNNGRFNSINGGITWDNGTQAVNYNTSGAVYTTIYGNFGDVVEHGGTLYMTLYAQRQGSSTSENVLMVSTDDGLNWTRRSTIAQHTSSLNLGQMGSEGPSETGMVRLDNGNLLAVYRTGQPFPSTNVNATTPSLFWSISEDDGFTWSSPKSLGVAGVFPLLRKLDDGSVALTYGRYGAKVMFADETGLRWSTPTTLYNGPTSGHTEMRPIGNGQYVYVHDQSGFYPPSWNGSAPAGFIYDNDNSAYLHALTLSIERQTVVDSFNWVAEYQGDVTPNTTAPGWRVVQSGAGISGRLWAEQGQDFLRFDTGTSSSSRTYYYEMDASDDAWAGQSFENGFVLEMRARVGSINTPEGAAVVRVGDGVRGEVSIEFLGNGINLDGSSQTTTFQNTREWVELRLTVAENPLTGFITAFLYLNGDYDNPVLDQLLKSSAFNGIQFGDLAASANGAFEVDYLRFAAIPEPGGLILMSVGASALLARKRRRSR